MILFIHLGYSIDINLPTECDDEYWTTPDGEPLFKQPPDKPSKIASFNCHIRLNQIMTLAHRTIVGVRFLVPPCNANVLSFVVFCEHHHDPRAERLKRARVEGAHCDRARLLYEQVG